MDPKKHTPTKKVLEHKKVPRPSQVASTPHAGCWLVANKESVWFGIPDIPQNVIFFNPGGDGVDPIPRWSSDQLTLVNLLVYIGDEILPSYIGIIKKNQLL